MYRMVQVSTWGDQKFCSLSKPQPCGQFLFLFLMTGKYTINIPGVVIAKPAEMAGYLEWPLEAFGEAFAEVLAKGMAKADPAGLVWLPKGPLHNKPASPNVVRGWKKTWDLLPECELKSVVYSDLKAFAEGWGKAFAKAFGEALRQPSLIQEQEQEQYQEQEQEDSAPPAGPPPLKLKPNPGKPKPKPQPTGDHAKFVAAFDAAYEASRGCKPEWGVKQGAAVKRLLQKPGGLDDAVARTRRMFEMASKGWPDAPDLGTLSSCWDKFAPPPAAVKSPSVGRVEPKSFDEYPDADEDVTW